MTGLLRSVARSVLAPVTFAQYAAIGLREPQSLVTVTIEDASGSVADVTHNHIIAALRPLTIGVMTQAAAPLPDGPCRLDFRDRASGEVLGSIRLRPVRTLPMDEDVFALFEVVGSRNRCLPLTLMQAYHQVEAMRAARFQRRNPHNFQLTSRDLRALFVYYICPRPVVLVSVEHQGANNVFPMDLIGPTASPWFSMALRLTSGAVPLMTGSRRMALASIPLEYRDAAYELGTHHKKTRIDTAALPFATRPSDAFGLPVTADALRVREVEVVQHCEVGSHMLFLTKVVRDDRDAADPDARLSLHHVHGAFRKYLHAGQVPVHEL